MSGMANKKSSRLEKALAKDLLGGRVQPGSGMFATRKNDVRSFNFLAEHKYTDAKSYSIKRDYWLDVTRNAFAENRLPAMVIEFTSGDYAKIAVIRYADFLELDKYLKEEDDKQPERTSQEE
jgi:hypothetical protein